MPRKTTSSQVRAWTASRGRAFPPTMMDCVATGYETFASLSSGTFYPCRLRCKFVVLRLCPPLLPSFHRVNSFAKDTSFLGWLYPGHTTTMGSAPPETLAAQSCAFVTQKPGCRQSSHLVRRWQDCLGCALMRFPTLPNWAVHFPQPGLSLVLLTLQVDGEAQSKVCVPVKRARGACRAPLG